MPDTSCLIRDARYEMPDKAKPDTAMPDTRYGMPSIRQENLKAGARAVQRCLYVKFQLHFPSMVPETNFISKFTHEPDPAAAGFQKVLILQGTRYAFRVKARPLITYGKDHPFR